MNIEIENNKKINVPLHPIRVVEQGKLPCDSGYWVFWSTASHDINAVYSIENIRVSSTCIMKLTMW